MCYFSLLSSFVAVVGVAAYPGHFGRVPTEAVRGVGVPYRKGEGSQAGAVKGLRDARGPSRLRGRVAT